MASLLLPLKGCKNCGFWFLAFCVNANEPSNLMFQRFGLLSLVQWRTEGSWNPEARSDGGPIKVLFFIFNFETNKKVHIFFYILIYILLYICIYLYICYIYSSCFGSYKLINYSFYYHKFHF